MDGADADEAGLFPIAATIRVFVVLSVLPIERLIEENERGECGVLQIFGLVLLASSSHQEAIGVPIVPGLESAAHFIREVKRILRSSSWVGAPGLTFILGVGKILGICGLSN